jgi:hypothetical protein
MPTGYTQVSAAALKDATGTLVANATITFTPVNNAGVPISFKAGGGGQTISTHVSATVTQGVFSIQLADTTLTTPVNVGYAVTLVDNLTGEQLLGPGYGCVQPSGAAWSFDACVPNLAGLVAVQTGPAGTLAVGNVTTGAAGSQATVYNSGSATAAVLNFNIPQGATGVPGVVTATGTNGGFSVPGALSSKTTNGVQNASMWGNTPGVFDETGVINALASGNGTHILVNAAHTIHNPISLSHNNIVIEGTAGASLTMAANATMFRSTTTIDSVEFRNLTMDFSALTPNTVDPFSLYNVSDLKFINCTITGLTGYGIRLGGNNRVFFSGCKIVSRSISIQVLGPITDLRVIGCTIHGQVGVQNNSGGTQGQYIDISHNTIYNDTGTGGGCLLIQDAGPNDGIGSDPGTTAPSKFWSLCYNKLIISNTTQANPAFGAASLVSPDCMNFQLIGNSVDGAGQYYSYGPWEIGVSNGIVANNVTMCGGDPLAANGGAGQGYSAWFLYSQNIKFYNNLTNGCGKTGRLLFVQAQGSADNIEISNSAFVADPGYGAAYGIALAVPSGSVNGVLNSIRNVKITNVDFVGTFSSQAVNMDNSTGTDATYFTALLDGLNFMTTGTTIGIDAYKVTLTLGALHAPSSMTTPFLNGGSSCVMVSFNYNISQLSSPTFLNPTMGLNGTTGGSTLNMSDSSSAQAFYVGLNGDIYFNLMADKSMYFRTKNYTQALQINSNGIFTPYTLNAGAVYAPNGLGTFSALRLSQTPAASTTASDHSIPVTLNGTTYYLRLSSTP